MGVSLNMLLSACKNTNLDFRFQILESKTLEKQNLNDNAQVFLVATKSSC
jgi:hypothetical protein